MYTLTGARFRKDRRNGRWEEANLSAVTIATLQVTHGDVWLFITYPSLTEPKAVRFDLVAGWLTSADAGKTVQQWLTGIDNRTLPFATTFPTFVPTYVQYAQAWHAGYDIQPITRGGSYNPVGSRYDKEDLRVLHPHLDPEDIAKHAMFTVNGLFHLVDYNEDQVVIMGGNRSVVRANDNQVGIYSFKQIGEIKHLPITESMIAAQYAGAFYKDGVYLTIPPSVDMTNKTMLLVIGGYLQVLGKTYTRTGDRTYKVDMLNLQLLERYYDSYDKIDLTSLGLSVYEDNPSLIAVADILQNVTLKAYLTLEQSFFVIVDSPSFFQELVPLDYAGFPGRYIDFDHRYLPLVGAYGRMIENHRIQEDGVDLVAAARNVRHNYDFQRRRWMSSQAVDAGRDPSDPFRDAPAYLRMIGVEK